MGKRVEVAGPLQRQRGAEQKRYLKVDALNVVAGGATAATTLQDAKVIGTEVDLALRDLFGAEQRLSALRGRVVVLNFWATYCEPCRKEMPDLAAIQNNYAALGVQVIGASADEAAARAKVLSFIKETKLNFPVWLGATTGDMERFGLAPVLPGTVIIGRDGRIAWHKSGVVKEAEVKKKIDELLAQAATEDVSAPTAAATAAGSPTTKDAARADAHDAHEEEHASSVPS
jgi:thiol-disulfide isomerase/thioredoxin